MKLILTVVSFLFVISISGQNQIDPAAVGKMKEEGLKNSKVMNFAFYLTDVSGSRLTGSPGFMRAATWAKEELTKMGLVNASIEPWGDFGKGWQQEKCYLAITAPYYQSLIAIPRAWTGSTPGKKSITGEVVLVKAKDSVELMQYAGKLKGKIIMQWTAATVKPSFEADGSRFSDTVLERMANAKLQVPAQGQGQGQGRPQGGPGGGFNAQRRLVELINAEQPALILTMNQRGNDGTVFVSSGGSFAKDAAIAPASVALSSDDYLRLQRMLEAGTPVTVEADVKTQFFVDDLKGYNVVAEIPGTDPLLKDELVMLGGHLDSWHGATGATDNAAGCSVMMEAIRILQASGLKPRRTIRIALWGGEEQGLIGSRNYVTNHFTDSIARSKVSAYYNLDNGTGKIRGIYLQSNPNVKDLFSAWLEPFNEMGAKTVTISNTGGTDHQSFDRLGIPGFQFIQDPIEYDTRTHHTNMDTYDHLIADDLKQASVIIASFVYHTAQRDEKIPRKAATGQRGF
jgi:carboxypeptidase Q